VRKQPGSYQTAMDYFEQRNAKPEQRKAVDEYLQMLEDVDVDGYLKTFTNTTEENTR